MKLFKCSMVMVFTVGLCVVSSAAQSQTVQTGAGQQAFLSQTVSVATLQVPAKAWKHFEKARKAAERHRRDESEQESTKALEIAPNFAKAYVLRATQEIQQQRFEDAIADAAAAVKIEPGVMWASVILAGAYNSLHRCKSALLVLDNVRGAEADTWQAKFERARAEIGCGDAEAALYWSALLLEAAPQSISDIYIVRTDAFLLAHRWKDAESEMKLYLRSSNPQPHSNEVLMLLNVVRERIDGTTVSQVVSQVR